MPTPLPPFPDPAHQIALVVGSREADGSIRLTSRDSRYRGTNRQSDNDQESRGIGQLTGAVFRAGFAFEPSNLSLSQCVFAGRFVAGDAAAIVGTLSCNNALPATPARIQLF